MIAAQPFPRAHDSYNKDWANRLVQRLDRFLAEYVVGERVINGALITNERRIVKITSVTASYQILLPDHVIESAASAAVSHTLAAGPSRGQEFEVQDSGGNAASFNITILPPSGITLNGAMTGFTISTNYGRAKFRYNGTEYIAA